MHLCTIFNSTTKIENHQAHNNNATIVNDDEEDSFIKMKVSFKFKKAAQYVIHGHPANNRVPLGLDG
ncbi:hypothetical protein FRX31_035513 [Thalictrum thalictroides]|uniref:Uncharacterized protein n=1 Tax=Thalictrum thalictroides TaxID=46969 RepID=A0A7J6URK1_THATH|nr:hypothetical protein FRX31_035513 [Thalictrum thalictroides]